MVWPSLFWVEWILLTCYLLGFYNFIAIRKLFAERKKSESNMAANDARSFSDMRKKEAQQEVA